MAKPTPSHWTLEGAVSQFLAAGFHDGDLVSHDWLRWSLGVSERDLVNNQFLLLERMEAFKTTLLTEHQVALQNVRGKGYRLVPPAEQARYAAEEASRYMTKGLRKADALLSNTRLGDLDKDERRRHTDTEVRLSALAGMVGKGRRDVFALFAPK